MARANKLPVNWHKYQLNKNSQELAGVTGAVNGVYGLIDGMLWATALVSVAVIGMVLYLWMNERKREAVLLLATGVPQAAQSATRQAGSSLNGASLGADANSVTSSRTLDKVTVGVQPRQGW